MDGSIGGKLTPPQFIRAGAFMCRHIHREGNGGPFLFPCTAGSTVATCVHRIGHMAHSTQLTIPAMHAHIKATESIILILSLSTGRTLPLHPHTHTHSRMRWLRLPSLGAHDTSTGTTTASASQDKSPGLSAAVTHTDEQEQQKSATASTRYKRSIQLHCNVHLVCLQAHTRGKEVKTGAEHVKGRTNKTVQRRCMAEIKRKRLLRLTILHRSPSSGNS
ncbi:hypothetical protein TCDM_10479 [Trypanosoma cruzi Dm28c]|uniref:Uncharacterized protein n=1 Tax=Trypanosoma cruzi Dm28c TaxID=1416333 RepID=V5BBX8_TRYCR|nr:hypothetical protein TCDM_10479 [Trypanosoma cruzi Dm28c]